MFTYTKRPIVAREWTPEWWVLTLACGHIGHGTSHMDFTLATDAYCGTCSNA